MRSPSDDATRQQHRPQPNTPAKRRGGRRAKLDNQYEKAVTISKCNWSPQFEVMAAYATMGQSLLAPLSCNRLGVGTEKYFQAVDLCALSLRIYFLLQRD